MFPLNDGEDQQVGSLSLLGDIFNRRLATKGRWCIYIRLNHEFPCVCFDAQTQESKNPVCPYCLGLSYLSTFEMVKCHVALDVKKNYSARSGIQPGVTGDVVTSGAAVYFRGGFLPYERDALFEVEWDVPYDQVASQGTPTRLVRPWRLIRPSAVINGTAGKPDLWICGMENYDQQFAFLNQQIRAMSTTLLRPGSAEGLTPEQLRPYGFGAGNRYGNEEQNTPRRNATRF